MEQAEMQAIFSHVFNRLEKLEEDMSVLQAQEKDLRTIVTEGFVKAEQFYNWTRGRFGEIDKRFAKLEDQIDTLAIQTALRFDRLEHRIDNFENRMDKFDGRMDRFEVHMSDIHLKLNKILDHLAIA